MPHLTIDVPERLLVGREANLIARVTDAVTEVYGEWVRPSVAIRLVGMPVGRWGQGGRPSEIGAVVTMGVRSTVLDRPDAASVVTRLGHGITEAVVDVLGEDVRDAVIVELVPSAPDRTFVGGRIPESPR